MADKGGLNTTYKKGKIPDNDTVKAIKISRQALYEFIYEKFPDEQNIYFDVDSLKVTDTFDINFERGEFIICAYNSEDENSNVLKLPDEIDLQKLMQNIPDTASTMFAPDRYKEFTKEELIELSR